MAKRKQKQPKPNAFDVMFAVRDLERFLKIAQQQGTGVLETQYLVTVHVPFEKFEPLCDQLVGEECNARQIDVSPMEAYKRWLNYFPPIEQ